MEACYSGLTVSPFKGYTFTGLQMTRGGGEGQMAVYGYIRVSTDKQASEGESLGVQQRQLEGFAHMHGWTMDRVFREEGISAYDTPLAERDQGAAMLEAVQAGDVIVASALDRAFRTALDALSVVKMLQKRGVSLYLLNLGTDPVTGNGMSKMFLTVAAAFAEAEADRIRERIAAVKKDQAARGRFLGGSIPFGFKVEDGALVKDAAQQKAILAIRRLRHRSGLSLRAIAADVSERFKVDISHVTVARVLRDLKEAREASR